MDLKSIVAIDQWRELIRDLDYIVTRELKPKAICFLTLKHALTFKNRVNLEKNTQLRVQILFCL